MLPSLSHHQHLGLLAISAHLCTSRPVHDVLSTSMLNETSSPCANISCISKRGPTSLSREKPTFKHLSSCGLYVNKSVNKRTKIRHGVKTGRNHFSAGIIDSMVVTNMGLTTIFHSETPQLFMLWSRVCGA